MKIQLYLKLIVDYVNIALTAMCESGVMSQNNDKVWHNKEFTQQILFLISNNKTGKNYQKKYFNVN